VIYAIGGVAGATYRFTSQGASALVDPLTLVGFTTVPLVFGLTVAAALSRRWRWVVPVGILLAAVAGLASIWAMPLQTDLDAPSMIALSLTHLVVAAAAVGGLLLLLRRLPGRRTAASIT
jgi:hypothetical protein